MDSDMTSDNSQVPDDSGTSPEILDSTVSRIWYSVSSFPGLFWNVLCWQLNPLKTLYYVIVTSLDGSRGKQRKLICWLEAMSGREVRDLLAVWEDGSIVCDIINAVMVGNCEPKDHHGNCLRHAQELASHHFKLLPAFSNSELQKPFNSSLEKRLWRYLLSLRNALKLRLANNMADQDEKDPEYLIAEEYVARGMGLILASKEERAIFFIYSRDDSSLADIHIHIKGPNGDCGEATAGEPIDSENHSIAIDYRLTPDYLKVCYIPKSLGRHELSLTRYGFNIPGSPFIIKVGEHTGPPAEKFSYLDWLTEEQEEEQRLEIERKRNLKVVSRVIDFITEKMHMTNDGHLVKIDESSLRVPSPTSYNLKRTGRSLSPRPKCKLSSQKRSKSLTNQKLIQAAEFLKFSTSKEEKKCVQDAASQVSEDFSMIHPVGIDQFQEKCQRIVRACDFLLSHAPKQKSLEILSTAEKILDIPYNDTLTHHKSSFELYKPDIDNCTPDINIIKNLTTSSSRSSETDDEKEVIKPCKPEINVTRVDFSDRLYSMRKFDDVGLNAVSSFNSGSTTNENISTPDLNREKDQCKPTSPQKDARMARKSFQTVGYTKAKRSSQNSLPTTNISDEICVSDNDNKSDNVEVSLTNNTSDEMCLSDNKKDNIGGNKEIQHDSVEDKTLSNVQEIQHDSVGEDKNLSNVQEFQHDSVKEVKTLSNVQVLETNDNTGTNVQEELNFEHSSTRLSRSREPKITRNSKQAKKVSNLVKQFENQTVCSSILSVGIELLLLSGDVEINSGGDNVENSMKTSVVNDELKNNNSEVVVKSLEDKINDLKEMELSEIDNVLIQNTKETKENVSDAEEAEIICDLEQSGESDETNEFSQRTCDKLNKNMDNSTSDEQLLTGNEINKNDSEINIIGVGIVSEEGGMEDHNTHNKIDDSIQDIGKQSEIIENDNSNSILQENEEKHEVLQENADTSQRAVQVGFEEDSTVEKKSFEGSFVKEEIQVLSSIKSRISAFEDYFKKSVTDSVLDKHLKKGGGVCGFRKRVTSTGDGKVVDDNDKESIAKINPGILEKVVPSSEVPVVINTNDKTVEEDMKPIIKEKLDNVEELSNSNLVKDVEEIDENAKGNRKVEGKKHSYIEGISHSNVKRQFDDLVQCLDNQMESELKSENKLNLENSVEIKEYSATVDVSNEECVLSTVKHLSFDGESSQLNVEECVVEEVKHSEIHETDVANEKTVYGFSTRESVIIIPLKDDNLITEKLVENTELNNCENLVKSEPAFEQDSLVDRDGTVTDKDEDNENIILVSELTTPPVQDSTIEKELLTFDNAKTNESNDDLNTITGEDSTLSTNIENVDSDHSLLTEQITVANSQAEIVKRNGDEAEEATDSIPSENNIVNIEHRSDEVLETSAIDGYLNTVLEKHREDVGVDVKEQSINIDEEIDVFIRNTKSVDQENNFSQGENDLSYALLKNKLNDAVPIPENELQQDDIEVNSNDQIKKVESVVNLSENFTKEGIESKSSNSHDIHAVVTNENLNSDIIIENKLDGEGNENSCINRSDNMEKVSEAHFVDGNLKIEAPLECDSFIISNNPACNVNLFIDDEGLGVDQHITDNTNLDRASLDKTVEGDKDIMNETNAIVVSHDVLDSQNIEMYENMNETIIKLNSDLTLNKDFSGDVKHSLIIKTENLIEQQEMISSESVILPNEIENELIKNNDSRKQNAEDSVIIQNKVDNNNEALEFDNTDKDMIFSEEKGFSNMDDNGVENLENNEKSSDCLGEDIERCVEISAIDGENTHELSVNIIKETEVEKSGTKYISDDSKINDSHAIDRDVLTDSSELKVSDDLLDTTCEINTNLDRLEPEKEQNLAQYFAEDHILEDDKRSIHPVEIDELDKNECSIEGDAAIENVVSVEKTQDDNLGLHSVASRMDVENIEKNIEHSSEIILNVAHDVISKSSEVEKVDLIVTNVETFSKNDTEGNKPVDQEILVSDDQKLIKEVDSNHEQITLTGHDRDESELDVPHSQKNEVVVDEAKVEEECLKVVEESLISVNEGQSISGSSVPGTLIQNEGDISENIKQPVESVIAVTAEEDIVENILTVIPSLETSKFDKEISKDEQKEIYFETENKGEDLMEGTKITENKDEEMIKGIEITEVGVENEKLDNIILKYEESNKLHQLLTNTKLKEVEEKLKERNNGEEDTSDNKAKVDEEKLESEDDKNKKSPETVVTEISHTDLTNENCELKEIESVDTEKASIIVKDTIGKSFSNDSDIDREEISSNDRLQHLEINKCEDLNIKSHAIKNNELLLVSAMDENKLDQNSECEVPSTETDNYASLEVNIISDISEESVVAEDQVPQKFEFDTKNNEIKDVNPDLNSPQISTESENNDTTEVINVAECSLETKTSNDVEDESHIFENEIEIDQNLENNGEELIKKEVEECTQQTKDEEHIHDNKVFEQVVDDRIRCLKEESNDLLIKAGSEYEIVDTGIPVKEPENSLLAKDGGMIEVVEKIVEDDSPKATIEREEIIEINEDNISANIIGVTETFENDEGTNSMEDIKCQNNLDELVENLCNISERIRSVERELKDNVIEKIITEVNCETIKTEENCILQNKEIENKDEITDDVSLGVSDDVSLIIDTTEASCILEEDSDSSEHKSRTIDSVKDEHVNLTETPCQIQMNEDKSQIEAGMIDTSTGKQLHYNFKDCIEHIQMNEVNVPLNEITNEELLENSVEEDIGSNIESRDEKSVQEISIVNECGNTEVVKEDDINLDNLDIIINSNSQKISKINNDELLGETNKEGVTELVSEIEVTDSLEMITKALNVENCSEDNARNLIINSNNSDSEQSIPIVMVNVEDENNRPDESTKLIDVNEKIEEKYMKNTISHGENIEGISIKSEEEDKEEVLDTISSGRQPLLIEGVDRNVDSSSCDKLDVKFVERILKLKVDDQDVNQQQNDVDKIPIKEKTVDRVDEIDNKQISCEDNLQNDFSAKEPISDSQTVTLSSYDPIITEPSSSELLVEMNFELKNEQSHVLSDPEPEKPMETIEVTMDLSEGIPDSIFKNNQEETLEISGDNQHVTSNFDLGNQYNVNNEGVVVEQSTKLTKGIVRSITISNEHDLNDEDNISENTFLEVGIETSRDNKEYELSTNNKNNSKDSPNEEIITDLSISTTDEKIESFNIEKGDQIVIGCNQNKEILNPCMGSFSEFDKDLSTHNMTSITGDAVKIDNFQDPKLEELKSIENELIFSDELITSVESYDLIESSQPNEGLFDKELVDDLDLSLDEVSSNHNDKIIIDYEKIEGNGNKFSDEVLEESKIDLVTSETIDSKLVDQISLSEETIVEPISYETSVDDLIKIEQTASAGIETRVSISKYETSTDLKICSDESVVFDEKVQNEDLNDIFCDNILESNIIMDSDQVISNNESVNLEVIDVNEDVISEKDIEQPPSSCSVQTLVFYSIRVGSPIAKDINDLTYNFKPENISDQLYHCSENFSNNSLASDVPQNESTPEIEIIENDESSIIEGNRCQLVMSEKQSNEKNAQEVREINMDTAEEIVNMVESDKQLENELKNEDRKIEDVSLEIIDVNDDSMIQVNTRPAATETTVNSSSEVECIRNESPSNFQLSELSLGRQETFLLVSSSKNDPLSGDTAEKSGVKSLIEKFSNNITASKDVESILEPDIVKCNPLSEKEKVNTFYEMGENSTDQSNKLSKIIQHFECNIVDEGRHNVLKTDEEVEKVKLDNGDINKNNDVIENEVGEEKEMIDNTISKDFEFDPTNIPSIMTDAIKNEASEDKEMIDNTIPKDLEFDPTNIPTILTDIISDEKSNEDETFPFQHEFDLCSIGSHDDDVVSKSYTDINDGDNESLTKNENFGSTEHLLLCVESMEDLGDATTQLAVTDGGENNPSKSMNNDIKYDKIICDNEEARRSTHEDQSLAVELTETENHDEMYHNVCGIDSMNVDASGEVMKRYGTSNDLLADLIIEENSAKNETEVEEKSLVSFIDIDESINLNKEKIVSSENGSVEHPLVAEEKIADVETTELKSHSVDLNNSENIGQFFSQNSCVTQDDSSIVGEQTDLSQDKVKSQDTVMEMHEEVALSTSPPSVESHKTENESSLNDTDGNQAENTEPRDVCYEIFNEISNEKSRTEEDSLLKTSISDKQGTDSTGSELNRSISLIVNSSIESEYNFCNNFQDDGAQISECVLEVLMSNNENLESVEEPERDSIEDILTTEAGEACVDLGEKQVTEELAWLNKQSNELEEPASLSSFNLWPLNTVFEPSNEPNPTTELSEDIDFDSIISAPSLDEALKKFEKRLSDKMSKETASSIEKSNESNILEGENFENKTDHNEIIMENQDKAFSVDFEKSRNESNINSEIELLLKNKENDDEGFSTQDIKSLVNTENSQIEPNSNSENGLQLDGREVSITPSIEISDFEESTELGNNQNESNLTSGIDLLGLKNDEDSIASTLETLNYKESIVTGNSQNECNNIDSLLENVENNEGLIKPSIKISVDSVLINTDISQKQSNSVIEMDLVIDDDVLIDTKNSQSESNINSDINSFLGSIVTPITEILNESKENELIDNKNHHDQSRMSIGIDSFLENNKASVTPIEETSDDNELIITKSSQIESNSRCDIDPLLVNVGNEENFTKPNTTTADNEITNNDEFTFESNLKCDGFSLLENTENNKGSNTTNVNTLDDKDSTHTSNFDRDSDFYSVNDLLKENIENNETSIIKTEDENSDHNELVKENIDIFFNNDVLLEIDQSTVPQTYDAEKAAHTNSLVKSSPAGNDVEEVNDHNTFQIDENIQDGPESLIKYCVPCDDTTSYLSSSNNHLSRPPSRMEIIREETDEVSDNLEVEGMKQMGEEGLTPFLDSDDVSVSDISECLEKFDSLIQEAELRDRDLLDIDDNRLIQISVTDCDSEEHSDNLLPVESEIPECDRMMNENISNLELEHQHYSQVHGDDNMDTGSRNDKFVEVHEVHEIVHYNNTPHDKSAAVNLKDGSNDCQKKLRDDKKVGSNLENEELKSTVVSDDGCKKTERKPRKSLVKSKKMFWDEKLKNLQVEQENKSKMLIEKRTRTFSKDNSNRIAVVQQNSRMKKCESQQYNQKKSTDAKNENLEKRIEKSSKQTHSNNDTSLNRNLIIEEPIKIVVDLSDENSKTVEDRKSVGNWKNYWNNLLVNEKDEDLQTMRRQPSIRVKGIVASSRSLFEKPNSSLERSVSCEMLTYKSVLSDEKLIPARSVGENLNKIGLETPFKCHEGHKSRADGKSSEIPQKSESITNISERIKFFERSSKISNSTEEKSNNNIEITNNLKNKRKSSIENISTPCSPTTIRIDYFDDQETLPHQILENKRMKSESIDSSDGDMYNPLTMTLSGRVRSFSIGKIEQTTDGSLSNIEEDRSVKGSDQCLEKRDEELIKTGFLETTPLSRAKSEGNLSMNEKITSRARFEQAKSFFKCLEKENLGEKKAREDCVIILKKPGRLKQVSMDSDSCGEGCKPKKKESKYRRRGRRRRKDSSTMKVRSAPTSDTECRMTIYYDNEFGGSERHKSKRIADRFHVRHLFRDISGDTDGIFKGIPNRKAVLASLEDLRTDSVPDEQRDYDEPNRSQSLSSIPSGYQDEYPYLPTTPPSQYRHRSQLEDRLISRCKLVTCEMEIL